MLNSFTISFKYSILLFSDVKYIWGSSGFLQHAEGTQRLPATAEPPCECALLTLHTTGSGRVWHLSPSSASVTRSYQQGLQQMEIKGSVPANRTSTKQTNFNMHVMFIVLKRKKLSSPLESKRPADPGRICPAQFWMFVRLSKINYPIERDLRLNGLVKLDIT